MPLVIDPSKNGFEKVLRDYQIEALNMVWKSGESGTTSREVYQYVNGALQGKTVSRASIINFLNSMCEEGVLNYEEETCKGGMRRKYSPGLDKSEFKTYIATSVMGSLMKDFPNETLNAMREVLGPKIKDL